MAGLTTDAAKARRYLERALAVGSKPDLDTVAIDDLMEDAVSDDADGNPIYLSSSLNQAASVGWQWKSALVADQYDDIGGGNGKYLKQNDWKAMCLRFASLYGSGAWDVLHGNQGTVAGSIGSIAVTTSTAAASPYDGDWWEVNG